MASQLVAPCGKHFTTPSPTTDTGVGLHHVDLPTGQLALGAEVDSTFFWSEADRSEGQSFKVTVVDNQ